MVAVLLAFLTAIVLAAGTASPITGTASIIDGDTIDIHGQRIRLHGIDAVESGQTCTEIDGSAWRCGRSAAFALADKIGRTSVRCERRDIDRYQRIIAVCHVENCSWGGALDRDNDGVPCETICPGG